MHAPIAATKKTNAPTKSSITLMAINTNPFVMDESNSDTAKRKLASHEIMENTKAIHIALMNWYAKNEQ